MDKIRDTFPTITPKSKKKPNTSSLCLRILYSWRWISKQFLANHTWDFHLWRARGLMMAKRLEQSMTRKCHSIIRIKVVRFIIYLWYFRLFIRRSCAICNIIKTAKNALIWISKQYAHSRSLLLFSAKYLLHKNHIDDATIIPQNIKSTNVTQRINSIISPGPTPITNPKQTSRDVNIQT